MRIPIITLPKNRALLDASNDDDDDAQSLELTDILIERQRSSRTLGSSSRHSPGSFASVSWSSSWHSSSTRVMKSVRQSVQSKMRRPIQRTISVKSGEGGLDMSPKRYCEFAESIGDVCFHQDEITTMKISSHTGTTSSSESIDPSSNKSESDDEHGNEGVAISPHRTFITGSVNEIVNNCLQLNLSNEQTAVSPQEYTISNPAWMSPIRYNTRTQAAFPSLSSACEMEMEYRRNLRLISMEHAPLVVEHHSRRRSLDHQVSSSPQAMIDRASKLHPATLGEDFAFDTPKQLSFRRRRADINRTPRRKVERNIPKREIAGEHITLNTSWHKIQRPFNDVDPVHHSSPRRRALNPDAVLSRVMTTPGRHHAPRTRHYGLDIQAGNSKNLTASSEHGYSNSVAPNGINNKDQMERISPSRASGFYSKRERVQFDFDIKDLSKSIHQTPKLKASLNALKRPAVHITKPLVDLQSTVDPAVSIEFHGIC